MRFILKYIIFVLESRNENMIKFLHNSRRTDSRMLSFRVLRHREPFQIAVWKRKHITGGPVQGNLEGVSLDTEHPATYTLFIKILFLIVNRHVHKE